MQELELGIVTAGAAASLILQGIKYLWRKWVAKDMLYEFPAWFYAITLPVLNIAVIPLLFLIGFSGFAMPTDWKAWLMGLLQIFVQSLVSFFIYNTSIKPFNMYREALRAKANAKLIMPMKVVHAVRESQE